MKLNIYLLKTSHMTKDRWMVMNSLDRVVAVVECTVDLQEMIVFVLTFVETDPVE